MRFAPDFWRSKVTWTGLGAIAYAATRCYLGKVGVDEAALAVFTALGVIFGRDTVAKGTANVVQAVDPTAPTESG